MDKAKLSKPNMQRNRTLASMSSDCDSQNLPSDAYSDLDTPCKGEAWVFGYGSLMWNPAFHYAEKKVAWLRGYQRIFAMLSTRNRGTPCNPGLILSLAPGGVCQGLAYRIAAADADEAFEYLSTREGLGRAHRLVMLPVLLDAHHSEGEPQSVQHMHHSWVPCYVYLPRQFYASYIPFIPLQRKLELICQGCGSAGKSRQYLENLVAIFADLNIQDSYIEQLFEAYQQFRQAN